MTKLYSVWWPRVADLCFCRQELSERATLILLTSSCATL
jgi:hypothetical protein